MAYPPPNTTIPELQRLDTQRFQTLPVWKRAIVRIGAKSVMTDEAGLFVDGEGKPLPFGAETVLGFTTFTGFIITAGVIVTAAHGVINRYHPDDPITSFRLNSLEITDIGGQPLPRKVNVDVLAVDTGADVALLSVPKEIDVTFAFSLAAHGNVQVGQTVHTFGHPTNFPWDFRSGCIAHTYRLNNHSMPNPRKMPREYFTLQVDILTPPGFSGGPLIASSGEVVGVTQSTTNIAEEIRVRTNNFISFSVPVFFIEGLLCWYLTGGVSGREIFLRKDGLGHYHSHLVQYAKRENDPSLAHVLAADLERVRQGLHE